MTLNACKTHRLAVIAFVVAIAGMMLPAISTLGEPCVREMAATTYV